MSDYIQMVMTQLLVEAFRPRMRYDPAPPGLLGRFYLADSISLYKELPNRYDGWKQANKVYVRCLWHTEKTPSLVIYPERVNNPAHYHCYGCHEHGRVKDFQ